MIDKLYASQVDHLVNTMKPSISRQKVTEGKRIARQLVTESADNIYAVDDNNPRKSFDELYEEYSAMSIPEQIENLKGLGRDVVNKLDKIIDQLDTVLEDE